MGIGACQAGRDGRRRAPYDGSDRVGSAAARERRGRGAGTGTRRSRGPLDAIRVIAISRLLHWSKFARLLHWSKGCCIGAKLLVVVSRWPRVDIAPITEAWTRWSRVQLVRSSSIFWNQIQADC